MKKLIFALFASGMILMLPRVGAAAEKEEVDPSFDARNELFELQTAVAAIKTPIQLRAALEMLHSSEKLKWCCTRSGSIGGASNTDIQYSVVAAPLKDRGYFVVFSGRSIEEDGVVTRLRFAYQTPLGELYYADLEYLKQNAISKKRG